MSARLLALILLVIGAVASGIGVVSSRQQSRQLFSALSELERGRDELNIEYGRLQLEQATWTETNRLEQLARNQLGMVFPGPAETVVIRR
ncbi:MAG: cell division protein FtsL [Pseudomonadota bacterium]|nr:cell division protein FtsL [Pseudomonadota bacterium]